MKITLSPVRMDCAPLEAAVWGSALSLNGVTVDLPSYDPSNPHPLIIGTPVLAEGQWQVHLILPHGPTAPEETRWPAPITVVADGPIDLPPYGEVTLDPELELEEDVIG